MGDIFTEVVPEGFGMLAILDTTGDTRLSWDRSKPKDVEDAKKVFDELTRKGFAAFLVGRLGRKNKKITEFRADAEKIILIPPIAGG